MPKGVYERKTEAQRFWEKVDVKDNNECWNWTASLDPDGYGWFSFNLGKTISSHRYSYLLHFKEIGEGLMVRHKCDNPSCVNPAHLELGAAKDNSADMIARNRSLVGEKSVSAKITDEIALSILKEYKTDCDAGRRYGVLERLAKKHNLPAQIVSRLTARKTFRHLVM